MIGLGALAKGRSEFSNHFSLFRFQTKKPSKCDGNVHESTLRSICEDDDVWKRENESGAGSWKVDEHPSHADAVLIAEFEAWPEPKVLSAAELRDLVARFGGSEATAQAIGASGAFVRQNAKRNKAMPL